MKRVLLLLPFLLLSPKETKKGELFSEDREMHLKMTPLSSGYYGEADLPSLEGRGWKVHLLLNEKELKSFSVRSGEHISFSVPKDENSISYEGYNSFSLLLTDAEEKEEKRSDYQLLGSFKKVDRTDSTYWTIPYLLNKEGKVLESLEFSFTDQGDYIYPSDAGFYLKDSFLVSVPKNFADQMEFRLYLGNDTYSLSVREIEDKGDNSLLHLQGGMIRRTGKEVKEMRLLITCLAFGSYQKIVTLPFISRSLFQEGEWNYHVQEK